MTSNLIIPCNPCLHDGITSDARAWCTNCEDGLCNECETSHKSITAFRDHNMVVIEEFCQTQDLTVNLNCEIHGERFELYCKKHDIAVCKLCIQSDHQSCSPSDVISIDEASKHAKQSIALADLDETISRNLENVRHCIDDQKQALQELEKDEQSIKKAIADTRMHLYKYLDELERKILQDLKSKHGSCRSRYIEIINQLTQKENDIEQLRELTILMKRFASDLQVFVGTRQLDKKITEKMRLFQKELDDYTNNRMKIEIHKVTGYFFKEITQFGEIKVFETDANIKFKDAKISQAQKFIHGFSQNALNVSLELKRKFDIKRPGTPISGCILLPDGRIIIADYYESGKLMEYDSDGKHIRDIPVYDSPFDLTAIDTDRIAVTYGFSKYLEIISTKTNSNRKVIGCSNHCWGISYQDEKLYVVVYLQGILVIDLNGEILHTIDIDVSTVFYIATTRDRIYHTVSVNDSVHCSTTSGQEIWVFKDQSISCPKCISVDNDENVFVAGELSHNLTLIQRNGQRSKILLSDHDELNNPCTVHYSKEKKIVCLGYTRESIALYQVS